MNRDDDIPKPVALWRRLAAACYDGCIVLALWFIATALVMPLSHGAITPEHPLAEFLYQLYLLAVGYGFFAGFWLRDGQTLIRYLAAILSWACLGLGFWWSLFDSEKKTWHDRLSGTELRMTASFAVISNPQA